MVAGASRGGGGGGGMLQVPRGCGGAAGGREPRRGCKYNPKLNQNQRRGWRGKVRGWRVARAGSQRDAGADGGHWGGTTHLMRKFVGTSTVVLAVLPMTAPA